MPSLAMLAMLVALVGLYADCTHFRVSFWSAGIPDEEVRDENTGMVLLHCWAAHCL